MDFLFHVLLGRENMEKSDGHERDLSAEEESNDNNEHQGGALGISLVEEGVHTGRFHHSKNSLVVESIPHLLLLLPTCKFMMEVPMMTISELLARLVLLVLDPMDISLFFLISAFFMPEYRRKFNSTKETHRIK